VQNISIDYTNCATEATSTESAIPSKLITRNFKSKGNATQINTPATWALVSNSADAEAPICQLQFTMPNTLDGPVLLYYKLTNFYQNHRRYVKSVSQDQLDGKAISVSSADDDCDPLGSKDGKIYYPCGLIANSQFNDSISMPVQLGVPSSPVTYEMTKDGIAWASARKRYKKTSYTPDQIIPPPNWVKRYPQGYNDSNIPDFSTDYDFQNWMRTAGLPTFSKLYYRQDSTPMQAGTYQISITLNFNVNAYGGTKSIVISTRSVIGGRNPFLGIAYIVVGGLCVVLGLIFTARHLIKPRKLGDHRYLTWNQGTPGGRHE
jgi:hypothetical protein